MTRTNWAGNITYGAERVALPATIEEAQEIVRGAARLRAIGSRHCFNAIADTTGIHLSLERLNRVVSLDRERRQVTVEAGARYGDVGPSLHEQGFTLHNYASLPHISIAGAAATATHGSGMTSGNLATAVAGIEFIDAAGDLVTLSRAKDGETFAGAVVHLGALGVVTRLTLDLQPAFEVRQDVFRDLPYTELESRFDDVMGAGYSVSLFTDWRGDTVEQVWIKSKVAPGESFAGWDTFFGARPAGEKMHPVAALDPVNCTDQMGVAGAAYDRLPHFVIGSTPAGGEDYQVEYFVPWRNAVPAVRTLRAWSDRLAPVLMISEVRSIAADDLWLSPAYCEPCAAFHFSFKPDWPGISQLLPHIEAALAPLEPRPHWGKLFTMAPQAVQARYAKLPAFRDLIAAHDPKGKFRNAFVEKYVFGS